MTKLCKFLPFSKGCTVAKKNFFFVKINAYFFGEQEEF